MNWLRPSMQASRKSRPVAMMQHWPARLWLLFVASMVIGVILSLTSTMTSESFSLNFLRMGSLDASDSWGPMRIAIEHLRDQPDVPVYQAVFFTDKVKFQYPLSSLIAIDLFQQVSGLRWETVFSLLNRLSWYSVWLTGFACWRLFVESRDDARSMSPSTSSQDAWLLWPYLGLTVLFYPLSKSYALGQIQTMLTLLGALALLAWQADRRLLAGLFIGLCCAVKPQWSVILLWAALRREWGFVAVVAGVCGAITLAALARYGLHNYLDYLSVLSFLGQRGEAYFPNQSVNGLLNRLLFNGANLTFDIHGFPEARPEIETLTMASSVLILAVAIWIRRTERPGVLDLAIVLLAATMASPIAWEHHYGILLPIFALLAPICLARRPFGSWSGPLLAASYVLASQRFDIFNRLADTPFNILQSYLLAAAIVVLVLLFRTAGSKPLAIAA
jgi:hypothetical protein